MSLADRLVEVHRRLTDSGIGHAFGGALALAYYAEPRATADIDVNVFVPFDEIGEVIRALAPLGFTAQEPAGTWLPAAGVRLRDETGLPLDLFAATDDTYDDVARRVRTHPFGPARLPLPFLGPEDLAAFKLSFGRPRDWNDLAELVRTTRDLDIDLVETSLIARRGPQMYPRVARLRALYEAADPD